MNAHNVKQIKNLSDLDKLKIYHHYHVIHLCLKYDFTIIHKDTINNWIPVAPDKIVGSFVLLYNRKNIMSFDDFISDKNIDVRYCGKNWKENGFAQEYWTQYSGIYDWYWKFKDEIYIYENR